MAGELQETIAAIVPGALFALAAYLYYVDGYSVNTVLIWVIWGFLTALLASKGPPRRYGTSRSAAVGSSSEP